MIFNNCYIVENVQDVSLLGMLATDL